MHPKWWTLIAVCVATFMLLLDITIVNVALVGIATGIAALGAIFQGQVGGGSEAALGGARDETGRAAFVFGLNDLFVIAAVIAFVGAAASLALVRSRDFVGAPAAP